MNKTLLVLAALCLTATAYAERLTSPNGKYEIDIDGMNYSVKFEGRTIIGDSRMGVDIDNSLIESALGIPNDNVAHWCDDMKLQNVSRSERDTTWTPLYGENATIRDHYNAMTLHYAKGTEGGSGGSYDKRRYYAIDIEVRAYNEGIAFRYHFPETANGLFLHIKNEVTSFRMPEGTMAWYEAWAQGPYHYQPLSKAQWNECERPLLMRLPDNTYVALLEAAMTDFVRGKFALEEDNLLKVKIYESADVTSPFDMPWRVIMAANKPVELINNKEIVLNLNPECAISDVSFIRPGKAFRSGRLDKEHIFKSIDYCKKMGIYYVELDAGWYGPEMKVASDARKVIETRDFTMPEVCEYAKKQGIGVWVYVNQRALYRQLDELLPLYKQWGIKGIKFGFVHIGNQQWTLWLHEAVRKCAEHGIMVDIHDEYRPTGFSRTYPNLLTQEGIRGNEEMPDATHNVTLPFTRFLCGPGDYTLCYFNGRVKNTKAHQLAMAAVYYSPLQFLFWYDMPFVDKDEAELKFWRDCPTVFDESIALDGQPGEYIVQARRSGDTWFIGAMTNTEARTVTIDTGFLPQGKYEVVIYNDNPKLTTRTKVEMQTTTIKAGKAIELKLQPSGGAAMVVKKKH
ncbi:MAG: glycoside hydrolase family 97 N-terminal domain-containing protein [Prevotellaceae bacterium]|nr:glycoside hydrolase family 97 N-terminal domain-containing protein [Prevotellaceae bacterium]